MMSIIAGAIKALKKQWHPFHYCTHCRGAQWRSWWCGVVCVVLAQDSRQTDLLLVCRHGGTDS